MLIWVYALFAVSCLLLAVADETVRCAFSCLMLVAVVNYLNTLMYVQINVDMGVCPFCC
jgi:hypothetical protein